MAWESRTAHSPLGMPGCRVQGMRWEQNQESTLVCLLMGLATCSVQLCMWNQVKSPGPQGPQGPWAPGKTSGCHSFLSLKLGWRPRALVTECVALKHMFQLSCVFSLGVVRVLLFTPWNHVYNILLCNWTCIVSFFCYHPFHVSCIVSQLIIKLTVNHFSGLWSGNQSILWSFDTVFIIGIIG